MFWSIFGKMFSRSVGVDIIEVSRFTDLSRDSAFIQKTFTSTEIDYAYSYTDFAVHLAGIFAAKEAVSKALGTHKYPFWLIEITRDSKGAPVVYFKNKKLRIVVSISHTKDTAVAVALV